MMTVKKKRFGKIGLTILFVFLMMMLFASCFGTQVVISFNANGGKACDSITVTSDMESVTLPTTIKNGYDFTGWYASRSATTPLPMVLTGDNIPKESVTYHAGWSKKTVVITFVAGENTVETRTVEMDSMVEAESFPSLAEYPDYSWEEPSFRAVKDTTIAAVRKEQEEPDHTVKYMIPRDNDFIAYRTYKGKAGAEINLPENPSADTQVGNVYFSGWYADKKYTTPIETLPTTIGTDDMEIYARFTTITDDSKYLFYEDRPDGGINIIGLNDIGMYQTSISIPSKIDGKSVLSVGRSIGGRSWEEYSTFDSTFLVSVVLPSSLREIGDWSFLGCTALEEVVFGGTNVTKIGKGAFAGCTALRKFSLPENVTTIGAFAFAGIQPVASDDFVQEEEFTAEGLPAGNWEKRDMALSVLDLSARSKLSSIGNYAFYGCDDLKEVTLSAVMRDFNYLAFSGSGLENVFFQAGGNLVGLNGVVYSRSKATLYYYPQNREGAYTLEEETTAIAPFAFYANERITSVTMGDGVRSIGESAFAGCISLEEVVTGASAVRTIGNNAFRGCVSLAGISFSEGVETIGNDAFNGCGALETASFAGDTVTSIGSGAFRSCVSLLSFYVPAPVTAIGNDAFNGCSSLARLRFSGMGVLEEIGDYAFYECTSIGEVLFPNGVRSVGKYAFASEKGKMSLSFDNDIDLTAIEYYGEGAFMNTQIENVTISANIARNEDIGKYLFKNCTSLKQAYFSATGEHGYDTLPEGLFYGCTSLGRIVFTNNIRIIDKYAFYNCAELETAQFGDELSEIRDSAFSGCVKLTNGNDAKRILPGSLTSLGERAFYSCSSLSSVNIPNGITEIKKETFAQCSSLAAIYYDTGTTLGTIGENAFAYCTSLTMAMLPATLLLRDASDTEGLVKNPFYGCTHLTRFDLTGSSDELSVEDGVIYRRLPKALAPGEYADQKAIYAYPTAKSSATIRIPAQVVRIDRYAFFGCTIKGVTFERNDTSAITEEVVLVYVDDYAFAETRIESATLSLRVYHVGEGAFMRSALATITIEGDYAYDGDGSHAIINTDVEQTNNILSIGAYAFKETPVTEVVVPGRVSSLGDGAFSCDYSLESVTLAGGNITTLSVGAHAFESDNRLKEFVFPNSVVEIGEYALYYCNNIQTLSFRTDGANGLTIGDYAFAQMQYLYEVTLPANVVSLGKGIFLGNTRLKYINFPVELTKTDVLNLPDEMFAGLTALREITIPQYVGRVGASAFVRSGLRTVTFLGSETDAPLEIGDYAFYQLKTLVKIDVSGNTVSIGDYAFAESSLDTFVYGDGKNLSIGDYAFKETSIEEFVATSRVKSIGAHCFENVSSLTSFLTEGSVTDIPERAFANCTKLSVIDLTGVETLGEACFINTAITEILSNTITAVGSDVIKGSDVTRFVIDVDGALSVDERAFEQASKLTECSLTATGDVELGAFLFRGDGLLTIFAVEGRTVGAETGFASGAPALGEGFTLTETDTANATFSFDVTEHVLYNKERTAFLYYPAAKVGSTFVIGDSVTSIGDWAFYQNAGLTGLVIQGRETTVEKDSFTDVNAQFRIYVAEDKVSEYTNEWQLKFIYPDRAVMDGLVLTLQSSGEYSVTGYLGEQETLMINGTITTGLGTEEERTYAVTSIGENAFRNNTVVRNVYIGSGIKTIAGGAFRNCNNLEYIAIGENVTSIKSYAFSDCKALQYVEFTEGGSLLSIGNYAFNGDSALYAVELPTGVETLGIFAFAGCSNLFDVTLGEGLKEIGSNAFADCVDLPYVELPSTMRKLGSYVFSGCEKLIYVEMKGRTVCKIESNTFSGTPGSIYYFVPDAASAKSYKVDGVWRLHISKILPATERCTVEGYENYVLTSNGTGYTLTAYLGTDTDLTIASEIRCSETMEKQITGYNNSQINVKFDDCNPLFLSECGDAILSLSSHTTKSASESTIDSFNTLGETFAEFMGNFLIPTNGTAYNPTIGNDALLDYTQFFNVATDLYDDSLVSFTKNVKRSQSRSVVIGLNHPYAMTFGTEVNLNGINLQTVAAKLFGYADKNTFMNYAEALTNLYPAYYESVEALENGCFHTDNESFVFPIVIRNELSVVLMYLIIDSRGFVSLWVNDIAAALRAVNFNGDYYTYDVLNNELFCKNVLFVSGLVTVTEIGEYAIGQFAERVTIEEGITVLKERAFYNATALTEIYLPSTLTTIETYAFGFLDGLTSVTITDEENKESNLETIGAYAFYACYGLTSFDVPSSVTSIGAYAFSCPTNKKMNFEDILFGGQEDVFYAEADGSEQYFVPMTENGKIRYGTDGTYEKLDVTQSGIIGRTLSRPLSITTEDGNKYNLIYEAGTYIDREKATNILWLASQTKGKRITVYVVEETALSIGEYAFAGNASLRKMTFGTYRKVSAIGEGAFSSCVSLEELTIGYTPRILSDDVVATMGGNGEKTFENCLKLSIFLPTSAIKNRYENVWQSKTNKQKLVLSTYMDNDGFVFDIVSTNNKTVTVINYLGDDTVVTFPTTVSIDTIPYRVVRIGRQKTDGNELKGYVIGGNVTKVIVQNGVETVGVDAFRNSESLAEVVLPAGLKTIEQYAFAGCKALTTVNIPISVTGIEQYAFYDCDALDDGLEMERAMSQTAEPTLVIGAYAFASCDSLRSFYVPDHVKSIGVATGSSSVNLSGHTFDGCANLTTFTFAPEAQMKSLGSYVFTGTAIKEIRLPASVESVANYAFARCMTLERVYLLRPSALGVTSAGDYLFDGINNVHLKVYVPDKISYDSYIVTNWAQKTVILNNVTTDELYAYTTNETNKTLTITDYRGDETEITIPRILSIEGTNYSVTTLGKYFANARITKVTFAANSLLTTIEDKAFSGCTSLIEIHLPETLTNLGNENGGYVFENCTSLTDIVIPNGVTDIKASLFENCTALAEITLPESINYISSSAFASCTSLARVRVQFGSRLTSSTVGQSLDNSAFSGAGQSAGGLTIIVKDRYRTLFSGWTSISTKIYSESEVVGDFVVKLNDQGTALILVQYLGDETELDLTTLRLKGLPITVIEANSVRNRDTKFIVDGSVTYAGEYEDRIETIE